MVDIYSLILALGRPRQEDWAFKVILGYLTVLKPAWTVKVYLKTKGSRGQSSGRREVANFTEEVTFSRYRVSCA